MGWRDRDDCGRGMHAPTGKPDGIALYGRVSHALDSRHRNQIIVLNSLRRWDLNTQAWLALAIGNSRWHWAVFAGGQLQSTWDTAPFSAAEIQALIADHFRSDRFQSDWFPSGGAELDRATANQTTEMTELWIASVVPAHTALWQNYYPAAHILTLADVPLGAVYPTLGLDRALTLWGAIQTYGAPVLVIDGGTALTLTGADGDRQLLGGAIFPGLRSLLTSLNQSTAALPLVDVDASEAAPPLWGRTTPAAIQSGITHILTAGLMGFVVDWWQRYPGTPIVFTGGDGDRYYRWITSGAVISHALQVNVLTVASTAMASMAMASTAAASMAGVHQNAQLIFVGIAAVARPDYPAAGVN
jgi:type III pantothenate kinase